jgi:uncharacterized protein
MSKVFKVVIIHGSYGNPDINWFPWLKLQVESCGHTAIVPKFPTPTGQSVSSWKEAFSKQVGTIDQSMILVGHSVGVGFILNLLDDQLEAPVKGTFLIAGFTGNLGLPDYDEINSTFACKDFNWPLIKQNAGATFVVNGDNDPYVPISKGQEIADALMVPLLTVPGGGHLNAESGYTTFPLLEEKLRTLLT